MSLLSFSSGSDAFLEHCSKSSGHAFSAFTQLLENLQSPDKVKEARIFLTQLRQAWLSRSKEKEHYFSFVSQSVRTNTGDRKKIWLLLFPSIFAPEEWSFTFYEGLLRYPTAEFYDRRIVELGCGSGWITIALAMYSLPKVIYGVDLNPRAIVCSQLNLYLNALDDTGELIYDGEGQTLLDRVKFAESNLLEYFFSRGRPLDRIIGCIPQVLDPELDTIKDLVDRGANDEFLHSLSNYCEKQGYVEDRFGLGLLAKAVEQSIKLLRPTGKIVLNFGGRPGAPVLERLMTRRGLKIRHVWQTKVEQDPDTDISSLIEIERATNHRFEFFMTHHSNVPIAASTAQIYSKNGGRIFHAVSVYEGVLAYPTWLKQIFKTLQHPKFTTVKSALDLTENDADVAEERFYWLASLFDYLDRCKYFPYGATAGELALRERIAAYFHNYHSIAWMPEELIVTPSGEDLITNLLTLFEPKLVTVDRGLRSLIPQTWQKNHPERIIETPQRIKLLCQLIAKLKPALVITGLTAFEMTAEEPLDLLVNTAAEVGALLVIDISKNLNLSSHPTSSGLYEYLSENKLPHNVILSGDLIKNRLYPDVSLCFNVVTNPNLRQDLIRSAELTYSRVSVIAQFFYQQLLEQLLYFQTSRVKKIKPTAIAASQPLNLQLAPSVMQAFEHPAIKENELPFQESTIRLDYGENCLSSPDTLKTAIAEAFARQNITPKECEIHAPLSAVFARRYNIKYLDRNNFLYGAGVASLFNMLLEKCSQQQGTFVFPQGAYGIFRASLDFYNIPVKTISGSEQKGFKFNIANLEKILRETTNPWLYLNAPLANPTGALYSASELQAIATLAGKYDAWIIVDAIFSGLELDPQHTKIDLSWIQDRRKRVSGGLVFLGGIAKEFAAAGLRFGYMYSPDPRIIEQIAVLQSRPLSQTTMYAVKRFYEQLTNGDESLVSYRESQRQCLQNRAKLLSETLKAHGWTPIVPQGGLFLVAKPTAFLGITTFCDRATAPYGDRDGEKYEITITGDTIATVLFDRVGLTINSATWTGLPDYCRFVLSVSETEFIESLTRIKDFYRCFFAECS